MTECTESTKGSSPLPDLYSQRLSPAETSYLAMHNKHAEFPGCKLVHCGASIPAFLFMSAFILQCVLHSRLAPVKFPGHSCAGCSARSTSGSSPPPSFPIQLTRAPLLLAQNGTAWEGLQLVISLAVYFLNLVFCQ